MSGQDNLAGRAAAKENVAALRRYLEEMEEKGEALPRRGGQLNMSAIAKAVGVNRQVLYQNPECSTLLADFDQADQKRCLSKLDQAAITRENKSKVDKERAELEADNLKLRAQLASLNTELERLRRLERLMVETGKLP
ncbi:hypothetical protein HL658_12525 [Azospirillum sp. RWY-5-1]|uniref:Transposase n=1 Tax=Azospirillum oleiclasticum TaxID=2735135 RepID=A0ABX2TBX7_9PROT|nr:hypothetical protein [Azospirillum oleiclasticum]NYZ13378.1 hypothetical protein [Azospirillum oleiclasticum]NYZ20539.1 hypothetical protein [Azospirillum oleiclasticum]